MTGLKYINNVLLGTGVTELKLYFFCLLLYNTKYRQQGGRNMRLNQATDYAFRMVLYLASLPEGTKITGAALAEKQNIPERFLLKIMRSLTKAGIMKSYRGVEGGFALSGLPRISPSLTSSMPSKGRRNCSAVSMISARAAAAAAACALFMPLLPTSSATWRPT